jgi:hypothetical protein
MRTTLFSSKLLTEKRVVVHRSDAIIDDCSPQQFPIQIILTLGDHYSNLLPIGR